MNSMASTSTELGNAFEGVSTPYPPASSSKQPWDVFINHYGDDVKHTLATTIYNTLHRTGLRVFLDKEAIEAGDIIPTEIQEAMRSVSVHIAIFSRNYARSPWCLAELLFMLKTNIKIIPVFYHVEPSDLRWVAKGKGIYASEFAQHEEKAYYSSEKLEEWKKALETFSMHSGCVVRNNFDEGKLLKEIANIVLRTTRKLPFDVAKHPVGLDCIVKELERYIAVSAQSECGVQIVGIVGIEGVGKTTLAMEFYNQKCSSFDISSFIFNVRDAASKSALHKKQKKLLEDIDVKNRELSIDHVEEGKTILARRLTSLFALIVLDDVGHEDQLDALLPARGALRSGSWILVTTRELGVLTKWGVSSKAIYEMRGLDQSYAEELFCRHAFLHHRPRKGSEDLVRKYLIDCGGLPLAIKKYGEQVYKRSMLADSYDNACDIDWERKLPPHYLKILSRAVTQKDYLSKKEIYVALCSSIKIDGGNQIFWLDQLTGKIGLEASAGSLVIYKSDNNKRWRWVSTEDSRFGKVAERVEVFWCDVYKQFECGLLSPNTEYTVTFIIKIDKSRMHSYPSPFVFSLTTTEGDLVQSARFLDDLDKPVESHGGFNMTPLKYAENGWMEFVVGEFFLKEDGGSGRKREILVRMKNENSEFPKSAILLDGVKITQKGSSSKEENSVSLTNSVPMEEKKQIVPLDQSTGKIGFKASARSLFILWGHDDKKWRWLSTEESRFGQIAELVEVWFFKVYQLFDYTLLSPNKEYTVAFIVKIDKSRMHSHPSPFVFSLKTTKGKLIKSARFLDDLEKPVERHGGLNMTHSNVQRMDGWSSLWVNYF